MSANKYAEHLLVLAEDAANNELINGFLLAAGIRLRSIHAEPLAGGWIEACELLERNYLAALRRYAKRFLLLLVDFDGHPNRGAEILATVPSDLVDRVFVIGTLTEPEQLRSEVGMSLEHIGQTLAQECSEGADRLWKHPLLAHNSAELERLRQAVWPFLIN